MVGAGVNSRSKKSRKLENSPVSSFAFLVNCNEAFGYTHQQTLSSSYTLINAMLAEYSYIWSERNAKDSDENGEQEGVDYTWVDMPDWDNPGKSIRMKKYKDIDGHINVSANQY